MLEASGEPDQRVGAVVALECEAARRETVETPDGFPVHPVPAAQLGREKTVIELHGYNGQGTEIAQRGLGFSRRVGEAKHLSPFSNQ